MEICANAPLARLENALLCTALREWHCLYRLATLLPTSCLCRGFRRCYGDKLLGRLGLAHVLGILGNNVRFLIICIPKKQLPSLAWPDYMTCMGQADLTWHEQVLSLPF